MLLAGAALIIIIIVIIIMSFILAHCRTVIFFSAIIDRLLI